MRVALYRFYWKAESMLVPGLRSSQYAYYEVLKSRLSSGCSWLDLGCGHHALGSWMKREESEVLQKAGRVVGIDMCLPSLSRHEGIHELVFGNIEELPFAESSFDVVTANMVVEHLAQPLAVLQETFRVLKPGGVLVLHAPNYWNPLTLIASLTPQRVKNLLLRLFEGRAEADVFPTFYRLNTPRSIRNAARSTGLTVVDFRLVNTSALTMVLGPVALLELLWIRFTQLRPLGALRPNIIAVLSKPDTD